MKTSIDYGLMLMFLACLFACCACEEEAKNEKFLLRGGASSTIEKSLLDSVPTIGNVLSLNRDNGKVNSFLADKATTLHDVTKKASTQSSSIQSFSMRMLNSTNSTSCGVQSAEEIELEDSLTNLEDQLVNYETLANETAANYELSRDTYYDKDSIANDTFHQLLTAENDASIKGNKTIDDHNSVTSAFEAIGFDDVNYSNTMNSFNSSFELLVLQNETYKQSLIDGDQDEIQEAEDAMNQTLIEMVNLITSLNVTHSAWKDQLESIDDLLETASLSLEEYANSLSVMNESSLVYESTLLDVSAAKSVMETKEEEAQLAWNGTTETYQHLFDTYDALEVARNNTFQSCLSEIDSSSSSSSRKTRRSLQELPQRRMEDVCDCSGPADLVASLEAMVNEKEQEIEQVENDIEATENLITESNKDIAQLKPELQALKDEVLEKKIPEAVDKSELEAAKKDQLKAAEAVKEALELLAISVIGGPAAILVATHNLNRRADDLIKENANVKQKTKDLEKSKKAREEAEKKRNETKRLLDDAEKKLKESQEELPLLQKELTKLQKELATLKQSLDLADKALQECERKKAQSNCEPTISPTPSPTCYQDPADAQACDDPHLWTWEGKMYDYHGQCDLIYTTCPKFDDSKGLHLHLRTQFVEPNMWSTISSIAIKIGEDVLEVQNNGNYYVNGEPNVLLTDTTNLSDHALSQQLDKDGSRTIYKIDLKDNVSLYIKVRRLVERDSLSFTIKGVHNHRKNGGTSFDDCEGLSSTWEHPGGERFLVGRSGTHYAKHEAVDFGPEWQVDFTKNDPSLFYEDTGHQLPHQECIDSPLQSKDQRHLKALHEVEGGALARQAEEACGHLDGGGDLFDACFFDVLVTGDVTFAQEPWYNEGE